MKPLLYALLLGSAMSLAACSQTDRTSGRDESGVRGALRTTHENTGEVLDDANEAIESGVDSLDRSWQTPSERERRRLQERQDSNVDSSPTR